MAINYEKEYEKLKKRKFAKNAYKEIIDKARGHKYKQVFANLDEPCDSVISVGKKNHTYMGNPKIVMREGKSMFGEQIIFQILLKGKKHVKPKRSKYDTIEIYMPKKEGLAFLKEAVKRFGGVP